MISVSITEQRIIWMEEMDYIDTIIEPNKILRIYHINYQEHYVWGGGLFYGDGQINKIYENIYKTFPLAEDALKTYVGPNTTRERNEYVEWPNYFKNGFAELNCLLSSKLKIEKIF